MLVCLDVDYRTDSVVAAAVGFTAWTDAAPTFEATTTYEGAPADYESGQFYRRELPFLVDLLRTLEYHTVIVDGFVWLAPETAGLGAHLHAAIGKPVIGIAKRPFLTANAIAVVRGTSAEPLHVTAAGTDPQHAAAALASMHGPHRIPTLLKRVDRLSRGDD